MAVLISANHLSKSFGARTLFEDIQFVVESEDRIGLIGPNGAGKSTLLKILAGEEHSDSGDISMRRGLKIGFLRQTPDVPLDLTVEQAVLQNTSAGSEGEKNVGRILSELTLVDIAHQTVATLSGGWRKRVALARELVKSPELLLLDEPTNHLDIESILWLENFLANARFSTLTITHDRMFLQSVASRILELDKRNPQGLLNVQGDYATYLERKEALLSAQLSQEASLKNKLRRETEWLRRGPKARTTKQQARINAAENLQAEVEQIEARNQSRTARLGFESTGKQPKRFIEAKQITKGFGDKVLFRGVDLFIGPGDRVGLLGRNGSGKSTLIRVLLGSEEPDSGSVIRAASLQVAYFEQNREALDPTVSVRKTLCPAGDHVNYRGKLVHIHGYLDRFLFRKEQSEMPVERLSGGEQSRLLLAKLMLRDATLLVLDEPTNDLDVDTLDVLEDCLRDFEGAVILVTHDRYFLDQVSTTICAFSEDGSGKVTAFADLHQWENWRRDQKQLRPRAEQRVQDLPKGAAETKKKRLGFNETRELAQMETNILKAEARLAELQSQSVHPENISNAGKLAEIYRDMDAAQKAVETLYARWAELDEMAKP
jgi:ABC transport system ATP-binding/permease protein